MPVVFQQPPLVSQFPDQAEMGGIVQQQNINRQLQLQQDALTQRASEARAAGLAQSQAEQQRLNLAGTSMAGQSAAQQYAAMHQQAMQARQFAQQSDMSAQQAGQASALLQQRGQQDMAEFTQADQMRMNQLQQSLGQVDTAEQDGSLTKQQADLMRVNLQAGLGPLQGKQQAAKTRQRQQGLMDGLQDSAAAQTIALKQDTMTAQAAGGDGTSNHFPIMIGGEEVGTGYVVGGKMTHVMHPKGTAGAAKEEGPDVAKITENATKAFTKEDGTVDTAGLTAHVQAVVGMLKQQKQEATINKYGLGSKDHQLMGAIQRANDAGNSDAARDIEQLRQIMFANPDDSKMPKSAQLERQRIQAMWGAKYINPQVQTPANTPAAAVPAAGNLPADKRMANTEWRAGGTLGGAAPEAGIPAGYKRAEKAPDYIVPEHWQLGEHYHIKDGKPVEAFESTAGYLGRRFVEGLKYLPRAAESLRPTFRPSQPSAYGGY